VDRKDPQGICYAALTPAVVHGAPAEHIRQQWVEVKAAFPQGARFLHWNDNHDRNRADAAFGEKAALETTVLSFTRDGIPFLYNGKEIGDAAALQEQSKRLSCSTSGGRGPATRQYCRIAHEPVLG
jgi:glycosidase